MSSQSDSLVEIIDATADELAEIIERGGPGSGHFEHVGRPGKVGGSAPSEAVGGSPIAKIRNEVTAAYSGQINGTLFAEDENGEIIGHLDWSEFEDVVQVSMIFVSPELRRQGIGTALMEQLQKEFEGQAIQTGMQTSEGTKFIEGIGFKEDKVDTDFISSWSGLEMTERGGPGSGHHGHAGRPGEIGGSAPSDSAPRYVMATGEDQDARLLDFHPESQNLVWISPRHYLQKIAEDLGWGYGDREQINKEKVDAMKKRMKQGLPLDAFFVDVDAETGKIVTQEGRHRSWAAIDLGIGKVPVIEYYRFRGGGFANIKEDDLDLDKLSPFGNPEIIERGGPGSGFYEHEGRPGEVGGSLPSGEKPSWAGDKAVEVDGLNVYSGKFELTKDKWAVEIDGEMATSWHDTPEEAVAEHKEILAGTEEASKEKEIKDQVRNELIDQFQRTGIVDSELAKTLADNKTKLTRAWAIGFLRDEFGLRWTDAKNIVETTTSVGLTSGGKFLYDVETITGKALASIVQRHYGPGDHPSGSPQSVHAGNGRAGTPYTRVEKFGGSWEPSTDFEAFESVQSAIDDLNNIETFERMYAFFDDSQAYIIDGDRTSVSISDADEIDIDMADERGQDVALLHNHPDGGPFSPQDIEFAVRVKADEMWVVTDDADYVMRLDPSLTYNMWATGGRLGIIAPRSLFIMKVGKSLNDLDKVSKFMSQKKINKTQIEIGTEAWSDVAKMWPDLFQMEVRYKQ